ncbi:DUF4330 family protein [Tissierella sp. Yu-01]|uniref:DUF4330 family protein n=1 Tax=Tissierella sp. Yu-01 TaxID=3035694 RepID=UPI00240E8903|nr:DUF4330 family protein [Tissierella sp. Yu-01]WFA09128.1 DUF4330 family protein [Tissierella sp. Yu-01]
MKRKWNWIDTTIIVFILLAVVVFLNRGKLLNREVISSSNTKNIIITAEASELTADMVTNLEIGDQIFSQNSLQKGYISEIMIKPKQEIAVGTDGEIKVYDHKEEITITVEIEAEVATSGPYMELGGQEIKVGLPIIVKTTEVEFLGDIKHIEVN